jgi:hypothetical protein
MSRTPGAPVGARRQFDEEFKAQRRAIDPACTVANRGG